MECTFQNMYEEYFNVFMTNFMGLLGQTSSLIFSTVLIVPAFLMYSGKMKSMIQKVKTNMHQQTETHNE